MMNSLQKFAAEHDWYIGNAENGVVCRDITTDKDGNLFTEYLFFDNMKDLKNWAGY